MEETRFAILGTGGVAGLHRDAIASVADAGARLVAVGHHDPERSREEAERFGVPCVTGEELLEREDVDVICVCTPSGQHAQQAIAAARAGKHVLVEKPMALTLEDADAMISACREAGVKLGVTLQRRAEEPFKSLKAAVDSGALGRLTLGSVSVPYHRPQDYYDQAPWRGTPQMDGGALMNQGIHLLDLLVWYLGDPLSVSASAGTLLHEMESEDTLVAALSFPGGALATVDATTTAVPGFPHRVEVYGSEGGVQVEGETALRWETSAPEAPATGAPGAAGAGRDPKSLSVEGHAGLYRDFVRAIREDRPPLVSGEEGRRSLSAVLKIYAAAGL